MRLSRVTPGSQPTSRSPSRRLPPSLRRRHTHPSRLLPVEALELHSSCRPDFNPDRLLHSSHTHSKVQAVLALVATAERQLEDLLDTVHACPNAPTFTVKKRLEWSDEHDPSTLIKTTRASSPLQGKKRSKTQRTAAELPDFSKDLLSPFHRDKKAAVLTADEEKELGYKIQKMVAIEDVRQELHQAQGQSPTWEEIGERMNVDAVSLQRTYQLGREAKQTMIGRNMRLVISVASKMLQPGQNLRDLVADGSAGLVRAIEKFDPDRGYKLSTYAHWWIKQSIVRARTESSRVVRVPQNVSGLFKDYMRAMDKFKKEHGIEPTDEQLRKRLGYSEKRMKVVRNAYWRTVRIEEPLSNDPNSATRGDMIADKTSMSPVQYYAKQTMAHDLDVLISTLPERESTILRMRYGLDDGREYTLEEIGNVFHVTRERVRQLEMKALRTLRRRSMHTLKEYMEPEVQDAAPNTAAAHLKAQ